MPLLLSMAGIACGDSTGTPAPDAGAGDLLSVGGSYATHVALLPGGTCSGVTVEDNLTAVGHAPGSSNLTLTHAGITYSGTVGSTGSFSTSPRTVVVTPASYRITVTGQFGLQGLEATVTVEQTAPDACVYSVQWTGTKSGSPNVIPG